MNIFDLFARISLDTSDYQNSLANAESKTATFGEKIKSGLQTAGKIGAAAVGTIAAGVVKLTKDFADGITSVAAYGDQIDKESQKLGISAEAYQEWDAVLQHSGSSISSLSQGMKTLTGAMTDLASATGEAVVDYEAVRDAELAYQKSLLDLDDAQEAYNKTLKKYGQNSKEAEKAALKVANAERAVYKAEQNLNSAYAGTTSKLSDAASALKELGVSATNADGSLRSTEDVFADVITALQGMEEGAERTQLATTLLGRSAMDLGALLNTSAEDTQAMKDAVHELGGVLSNESVSAAAKFQDSLQDLKTAFTGLANNLFAEFLPAVTDVMDGITKLFGNDPDSGIEQITAGVEKFVDKLINALPEVLAVGKKIVMNLLKAIEKNLPLLMSAAVDIVFELINDIVAELPTIITVAIELLMMIVQGLTENLPILIPALVDAILFIVEKLTEPEMLMQLIDAAIQLIIALADGLLKGTSKLVEAIPVIIFNIISTIVQYFPQIVSRVGELLGVLWNGVINFYATAIKGIGEFFGKIGKTIGGWFNSAKNWGKDLIDNFVNGIKEKIAKVKETVSNIADSIKKLLGFSEPEEGPLSNFHTYAPDMMKLFAKGIRDNKGLLEDEFDEALNFAVNADMPGFGTKPLTTTDQSASNPVTIIVQSVLDGRVIGETAYKYSREKARAYGL